MNRTKVNQARVNQTTVNFTRVNTNGVAGHGFNGSTEDDYVLDNAILLKDGGVLLKKDGTPMVYKGLAMSANIGVLLKTGEKVPSSQVPQGGYEKGDVAGIYFSDPDCSFVIALEDTAQCYFCGGWIITEDPGGVVVTSARSVALKDYNGESNTGIISSILSSPSEAVFVCKSYTFPDGKQSYLGSQGEYKKVIDNIGLINGLLEKCGGSALLEGEYYWSSTLNLYNQYNDHTRWVWIWNTDGSIDGGSGQGYRYCRPLAPLTE